MQGVYLLHYERSLGKAQHYLGASRDVFERIHHHETGNGARMPAAFKRAGIRFKIARMWIAMPGENPFHLERFIKRRHNSRQWCPDCKEDQGLQVLMADLVDRVKGDEEPCSLT